MSLLGRINNRSHIAAGVEGTASAPSARAYLTDGATLFCVGHPLSDNVNGELFLELENCATSDVVLCRARALTALGLRSVTPAIAV